MESEAADDQTYAGVRHAYDTVAEDYAILIPDTRPEASIDLAMIDAFAATMGEGASVLDAGCGTGRMTRYLADRRTTVQGIDLSPEMVGIARRKHPDLPFAVGSMHALPYAHRCFDGVLLWYSIIHTGRGGQSRLFEEASRVLKTGGHLLVAFQGGQGAHDTSATYRRYGHEVELVRYRFTAEDVHGWMTSAGLEEVCRMVRRPQGTEKDDQVVLLAQKRQ